MAVVLATAVQALTLPELEAEQDLTPERFARHFSDFKFELGREVQPPEAFLARKAGDCDDFATLAAELLRKKGYSTKLVVVYMPAQAHVVCYISQLGSYLDYNRRAAESPLVKCGDSLSDVGASVARSFRAQWRSASEFTYRNGIRSFVSTEFH